MPIIDNCASCKLRRGRFFCALSPEPTRGLAEIEHTNSCPEGALVFVEGQAARGVYIVCQGRAKLMTTNCDGKTLILKIAQPGEILVISGKAHELTLETLAALPIGIHPVRTFSSSSKAHGDA